VEKNQLLQLSQTSQVAEKIGHKVASAVGEDAQVLLQDFLGK